jgi:hypothetical protein
MQCQKSVNLPDDAVKWKAIYNKLGKVTRRMCPACAESRKKFDATGVYKK